MADKSVEKQISEVLDKYMDDVREVVEESAKEAGKYATRELRRTSPRNTGEYATGWASKLVKEGKIFTVITYNRKKPGLTHLLENSHVIRNQFGEYGRTSPGNGQEKHISATEEQSNRKFEEIVREKLGNV